MSRDVEVAITSEARSKEPGGGPDCGRGRRTWKEARRASSCAEVWPRGYQIFDLGNVLGS